MQLSSRILTALAVLILAVAVVAVRAGSPDTVGAATGTIDVLNVGTCYATDAEVFDAADCVDGDDNTDDNEGYNVADREEVAEVGTVYATYAYDPKTAPDAPRGILENSNRIKVSISDTGRDKRTPVLVVAGDGDIVNVVNCETTTPVSCFDNEDTDADDNVDSRGYLQIIRDDLDISSLTLEPGVGWSERGENYGNAFAVTQNGLVNGITIVRDVNVDPPATIRPMFEMGDDSPIDIYGILDTDGDLNTPADGKFQKLNKYLPIDEDVGSGRDFDETGEEEPEVAPWFSVRASIPGGSTANVMYVVYRTSEREILAGGIEEREYAVEPPAFEDTDEDSDGDAEVLVEARADGRDGNAYLWLEETSRFSGRYEGYVELTDETGSAGDDATDVTWGLTVTDGKDATDAEKTAILDVESGPVVIAYRDTDGQIRLHEIEIDTVPPTVEIDTPIHKSQGQDTSPEFSGGFEDTDSGLRDDSFRLYIDHTNDTEENGDKSTNLALDLRVDGTGDDKFGYVAAFGDGVVETDSQYVGYVENPVFGVINHTEVFNLEVGTENTSSLRLIEGDPFADGATEGGFADSERISFDPGTESNKFNNAIDFQALVADVAGNIGFSDSDPDGPGRINDLGEAVDDQNAKPYNVLGWYARHFFTLDELDPVIQEDMTVTGFYGEDDDEPQVNRAGLLVAFDRGVDPDSIGTDTFMVTNDVARTDEITVIGVDPQGSAVYLLLEEDLPSDARPYVGVTSGQWVADPAGNRLSSGDVTPFEAKDGISPQLTVALSGGSGSGEGDEGPSKLTMDSIVVTIDADEEINSTPSLAVVCSEIEWDSSDTDDENDKKLSDLVGDRSGSLVNSSSNFDLVPATDTAAASNAYECDGGEVLLRQLQSYSRPGLSWEYQWVNLSGTAELDQGKLTVVAYARDRQSFTHLDGKLRYNWGATSSEFRYDNDLADPDPTPDGSTPVTESRPFVLLEYDDPSTVSIDSFEINGTAQEISAIGGNRFLYWPETLGIGTHTVSVVGIDAAGNEEPHEYSFEVAERAPFNLKLIAGWNAVSFPANPADNTIDSVFTEGVIDMVAGWDASDPEKPWSIATRMEGDWSTHEEFATLNKIHAQYGYWVHAQGFVTQRVALIGGINRTDPEITPPDLVAIPTLAGWNFVGVIDQDGDQTQGNFGDLLKNGDTEVEAGDYLGSNKRAYSWDAVRSEFQIVDDDEKLEIGDGIWVYYGSGIAP